MTYWVYIKKDWKGNFTPGLSACLQSFLYADGNIQKIVYLRSFNIPIDAAAHKHLLDDLSYKSLDHLIRHCQRDTENILNKKNKF
jgi:hypothetical protein